MAKINIIRQAQTMYVKKDSKTLVDYFLFDDYEIHNIIIPPSCIRKWQYRAKVDEVLLVTKGTMEVYWRGKELCHQTLFAGDLVLVKDTLHTFCNESKKMAEFIIFREVIDGRSKSVRTNQELEKNTR